MADHKQILRTYNAWRRDEVGNRTLEDFGITPRMIGEALDAVIRDAERWQCVRNAVPMGSPYAVWREASHVVLGKDADALVDNFLAAHKRAAQ